MINVMIADDHAIVRRGLKQILAECTDMVVGGEATNGHEALELVRKGKWDVVVLDMTMPGRNGLEVLKEIKDIAPRLPVLILSMHSEDQFAVRALKAGAAGYLTKESAPEALVKAIRKVFGGGKYVSPTLAEKLVDGLNTDSDKAPHENLSDREFEVLRLIASGKTVSQIGEELHLSVKTISTYRVRILEKMNLQSSAELTHYAIRNKLVE